MALFRRKQSLELDGFGPGDTLLATSGTLEQRAARELVQQAVLDDESNLRAQKLIRSLSEKASLDITNICSDVLERCEWAVKSGQLAREEVTQLYVSKLLLDCRRLLDIESTDQAGNAESLIILTTLRGTMRMLELGRRIQAAQVIEYGMSLALVSTRQNHMTLFDGPRSIYPDCHQAKWTQNSCLLRLESGSLSWSFDYEPDARLDFLYAEAAAAQMQVAYKQAVSFPDSERKLLDALTAPFRVAGESMPDGLTVDFEWDPPLPIN